MAQIGSWVPAARARLRMLDGIFTRMGGTSYNSLLIETSINKHAGSCGRFGAWPEYVHG
jgi:hypothetical protein